MTKSLKIEVLTGPQGGGKSTVMREEAIRTPGLYLFALPTTELIDEQVGDFSRAAPLLDTTAVHSKSGKGTTADRLTAAREKIEARRVRHAVIFTTHATLMDHPLEGFDGWHIRIDEAPAAIQAGRFNCGLSTRRWLKDTFDLVGSANSEWSVLKLKVKRPDWKAVERDIGLQKLGEFVKQAGQPDRVFVRATTWDQSDDIDWFSMWTPLSLAHTKSVQVAGSSYTDSVGFRAARALFYDVLGINPREIAPPRTGQPTITIHYFTQGHEGTTTFWRDTTEGHQMIVAVCDHLSRDLPATGYWSGNEIVWIMMDARLKGKFIKPLAMGLNKHRAATDCAFIYSGKATPDDRPLMDVFGLSAEDIQLAREDEAIAQFVMRGAIRDLGFAGAYNIYLYSERQAVRLRDHLDRIGFTQVELAPVVEAGIMDARRPEVERNESTPEERAAKIESRREADATRKRDRRAAKAVAAGRQPGGKGGRPTKRP